ncbi:hypothetical protein PVK06_023987 [Gossypium arboreum]|uniref:Uncharacterized protein n=1 Tax=Gossypium arboreum TaxID=29729 RepID=A0ABR0PCT3_GOSAR|nr:hypothetical protein PVK06_023987 [Gossypium arboreum]
MIGSSRPAIFLRIHPRAAMATFQKTGVGEHNQRLEDNEGEVRCSRKDKTILPGLLSSLDGWGSIQLWAVKLGEYVHQRE